jgi:CRISPR-associated protein Cas1
VCSAPESEERKIPVSDVLAVIVAARGVFFSCEAFSRLTESGAIILHCDDSYQPLAKTAKISGVIHGPLLEQQVLKEKALCESIWTEVIKTKLYNHIILLDAIAPDHPLRKYFLSNVKDEGNAARAYWKYFFASFGKNAPKIREHRYARYPVNQYLNYGYAVIGAVLHRSIVAHGLFPQFGIHHMHRFKSLPLVYDLMEPLRPFCDFFLIEFYQHKGLREMSAWAKAVVRGLLELKVECKGKDVKLLYAIDLYVSSIAASLSKQFPGNLFFPKMPTLLQGEKE